MNDIKGSTRLGGLIGNPIRHTMSPLIHNTLSLLTGTDFVYTPLQVSDPESLGDAVKGAYALNILGMNVTVPYKSRVIPFLADIDETAKAIGAVNTLVRVEGGYKGYNTDLFGLGRAIKNAGADIEGKNVAVIGAGGAARAAVFLCGTEKAAKVYILNRSVENAEKLAEDVRKSFKDLDVTAMPLDKAGQIPEESYIAIQCTKVGLSPDIDASPVTDPAFFDKTEFAYDCIYSPENTRFLSLAKEKGVKCAGGTDMLLFQGICAYELFNGIEVPKEDIDIVREKLRAAVAE